MQYIIITSNKLLLDNIFKPKYSGEKLESEKVSETPVKKQPQQKVRKEYTGPKVEGEDFDD